MKTGTQATFTLRLITLASIVLLNTACTKKRPAAWPNGEAAHVYEISAIENLQNSVTLSSEQDVATAGMSELQAVGEGSRLKVESVATDNGVKPMFADLFLTGQSGQQQNIKLKVGTKYVTALRVLTESEAELIPAVERSILIKQNGQLMLPVFQTLITEMGVVERTKNENNEETKTLRIRGTPRREATHIKFSTLLKDREVVGVSQADLKNAKEIFLMEKLDGRVMSKDELHTLLNVKVGRDGRYLIKLERHTKSDVMHLFRILKFSELEQHKKNQIIAQDRGQLPTQTQRCSAALINEFGAECVIDLAYDLSGIELVSAELTPLDSDGNFSNVVSFERAKNQSEPTLVRIPSLVAVRDHLEGDQGFLSQIDAASILQKKNLEGQEFLMRRTMQDSPNSFEGTFAGSAGPLEIVKFEFEKNRVRVIRADSVLRADGSTAVDRETLMVLPARYKKVVTTDASGSAVDVGRLIDTVSTDHDALAIVDWTQNSVPTVSSPLDFYELERCFAGVGERFVSEVDHRIVTEGILNFTLTSTYAGNVGSFDCAGIMDAGYFDTVQKNFTFKERISFKKHVVNTGVVEAPEMNMPLEAQKKLGFGLFTYIKKKANPNNVPGVDGTEDYLPSVFDIKEGKKITYVLAGLPQGNDARSKDVRESITASTRKVIDHLNIAFKKALKGTDQERSSDVLELLIEGVDVPAATLGDLDRNYIYFIDKATSSGIIGLGGSHANPRSGKVESASVYLYGGNMMSMVQSLRNLDRARAEYNDGMAGKFISAAPVVPDSNGPTTEATVPTIPSHSPQIIAHPSALRGDLKKVAHVGLELRSDIVSRMPKFNAKTEKAFGALEAVIKTGEFQDAAKIARIVRTKEAPEHRHSEKHFSPSERMNKAGICVLEKDLAGVMAVTDAGTYDISKKSDVQILTDIWAPTLAHEIGHNLGLRHNFIASFDEANHKFSKDEETRRDYSSVMDYLNNDHNSYDGLGPQDVMALRAAYAGSLELEDGNIVKIDQVKKALELNSWLDLSSNDLARLPLKKFMFCSDEEAGEMPLCNRFDSGTTPEKIVDFHIKAYRQNYSLLNFPNERIVFGSQNTSGYIGRLFSRFFAIRQMMEETILLASQQQNYTPFLMGAYKGLFFLNQVLRTPDLSMFADNRLQRFVQIEDNEGKKQIVEAKFLKDVAFDSSGTRLKARGIELDKVIALIALSTRDNSSARYADASIQFSLGDLNGADSPLSTQGVLKEILANDLMPISQGPGEGESLESTDETIVRFVPVKGQFRAEISDLMRIYGVIAATLNLDAPSSSNPAANFRVLSSPKELSQDMPFVQTVGAPNDLRFYAHAESKHARSVVERAFLLQQVIAVKAKLETPVTQWILLTLKAAKSDAEVAELAALRESINVVLATLPESVGTRDIDKLTGLVTQLNSIGAQLAPLRAQPQAHKANLEPILIQVEALLREDTGLALVGEIVNEVAGNAENPSSALLIDLNDTLGLSVVSGDQQLLLRNTQLLHQLLIASHDEFRN